LQTAKFLLEYIYTNQITFGQDADCSDDSGKLKQQFDLVDFALRYELEDLLTYTLRNILTRLVNIATVAIITNILIKLNT
jgi:hypothetical protein